MRQHQIPSFLVSSLLTRHSEPHKFSHGQKSINLSHSLPLPCVFPHKTFDPLLYKTWELIDCYWFTRHEDEGKNTRRIAKEWWRWIDYKLLTFLYMYENKRNYKKLSNLHVAVSLWNTLICFHQSSLSICIYFFLKAPLITRQLINFFSISSISIS